MNCSVLVVDDEYDIRQLLSTMLTMMGYQSFVAHDGLDALEKIPECQPDILINQIKPLPLAVEKVMVPPVH
jgi:CheY-like chemotaxis protein